MKVIKKIEIKGKCEGFKSFMIRYKSYFLLILFVIIFSIILRNCFIYHYDEQNNVYRNGNGLLYNGKLNTIFYKGGIFSSKETIVENGKIKEIIYRYEYGDKVLKLLFKDGLPYEGDYYGIYSWGKNTGYPFEKVTYIKGKREGKAYCYGKELHKTIESTYKNDLKDGKEVEYYYNGNVEILRNYEKGKINGYEVEYTINGSVKRRTPYVENIIHGTEEWFSGDHLDAEIFFEYNKRKLVKEYTIWGNKLHSIIEFEDDNTIKNAYDVYPKKKIWNYAEKMNWENNYRSKYGYGTPPLSPYGYDLH